MRSDGTVEIPLGGHGRGPQRGVTVIDAADLALVASYTWIRATNGYAVEGGGGVLMHRLILGLEKGNKLQADHVNQDKLDNRRANLRVCTNAENRQNGRSLGGSSQFRGVSWVRKRGRWEAYAQLNGCKHNLGYFDSEEAAAMEASAFRAQHMPFSEDARMEVAA